MQVLENLFVIKYVYIYNVKIDSQIFLIFLTSKKASVCISLQGASTIRAARRIPSAAAVRQAISASVGGLVFSPLKQNSTVIVVSL